MKSEPSDIVVRAWTRLMRAQQAALGEIQLALKAADMPPLAWYDVMLELERAGDQGLRPFELEKTMLLPQYGLSRLLDRIEAAGYVQRRPSDADGRGQLVTLTPAGRDLRQKMWPVYSAAIDSTIGDRLSEDQAKTLGKLLGKLIRPSGE